MTRVPRRMARALSAAVLGVGVGTAVAAVVAVWLPSAAQADTYRYWTYWKSGPGQSAWAFSPAGASSRAADGSVEGWRFALSGVAGSGATQPRATPSFDRICAGTAPVAGGVRVAVVVDFGTADAAPPGESPPRGVVEYCATRAPTMTGWEALGAGPWGSAVRASGGLVCGIDGYPRTECGARVSAVEPPAPPDAPTPPPAPAPAATGAAPPAAAGSSVPSPRAASPAVSGTPDAVRQDPAPAGSGQPAGAGGSSPAPPTAASAREAEASADPIRGSADGPGPPPAAALAGVGLAAGIGGAAWWRMRSPR